MDGILSKNELECNTLVILRLDSAIKLENLTKFMQIFYKTDFESLEFKQSNIKNAVEQFIVTEDHQKLDTKTEKMRLSMIE